MSLRTVDDAQYENRLRQWDYDMIVANWGQSLSPGNEQRGFWGSQAADQPGSRNMVGIKNPAVDALVERVIFAKNRDDLVAATRALDRVLLWNFYVVPQWTYGKVRTARWDRFGHPDPMPEYGVSAFPTVWWWDRTRRRRWDRARERSLTRATCSIGRRRSRFGVVTALRWRGAPVADAERARHIGLRRSEISRRFSSISTTSIPTLRKVACFPDRAGHESTIRTRSPSIRSTATSWGRCGARHGVDLCELMARSGDEPDAMYGFAARAVRISADGLTYRFAIRPEASSTMARRSRRRMSRFP